MPPFPANNADTLPHLLNSGLYLRGWRAASLGPPRNTDLQIGFQFELSEPVGKIRRRYENHLAPLLPLIENSTVGKIKQVSASRLINDIVTHAMTVDRVTLTRML